MSKEIDKNKKIRKFWSIWNVIESIVLLASGVLAMVAGFLYNPENGNMALIFEKIIAYAVAGFVILDGVLRTVLYLARSSTKEDQSPMAVSAFEISMGILAILLQVRYQDFFIYGVVNFVAVLLMVTGALLLIYAIYAIAKRRVKLATPIIEILFGAILVGVGVAVEIAYNTSSAREQLVLIVTGIILCLAAITMLILTLVTSSREKKALAKAEAEERGDYEVLDEKPKFDKDPEQKPVVVDNENITE